MVSVIRFHLFRRRGNVFFFGFYNNVFMYFSLTTRSSLLFRFFQLHLILELFLVSWSSAFSFRNVPFCVVDLRFLFRGFGFWLSTPWGLGGRCFGLFRLLGRHFLFLDGRFWFRYQRKRFGRRVFHLLDVRKGTFSAVKRVFIICSFSYLISRKRKYKCFRFMHNQYIDNNRVSIKNKPIICNKPICLFVRSSK